MCVISNSSFGCQDCFDLFEGKVGRRSTKRCLSCAKVDVAPLMKAEAADDVPFMSKGSSNLKVLFTWILY
jgi:hypothetical protein